jgi:hypothetical protein
MSERSERESEPAGEHASVRDDMIRAPTAIPVFTIRSFEPLAKSVSLASFLGERPCFSHGAAGAWNTRSKDCVTPPLRPEVTKTSVEQL